MSANADLVKKIVHRGRRLRGRQQLRNVRLDTSTSSAVIRAVRDAGRNAPSAEERAWLDRIEAVRTQLAGSPEPLEIVDFGAGRASDFGTPQSHVVSTSTRTLGQMTMSSKRPEWAYLLFRLVREFGPLTCLEMGACVGISASYQAAALELNGRGRLVTLEGSDVLAARSASTIEGLGLDHRASVTTGAFADTLVEAATELRPVQWVFVDGHHDEAATLDYLEQVFPLLAPEAVLVFDDINWSPGMRRAWDQIVADERFRLTVDLRVMGLAVVSAQTTARHDVKISYF